MFVFLNVIALKNSEMYLNENFHVYCYILKQLVLVWYCKIKVSDNIFTVVFHEIVFEQNMNME